MKHYSNIQNKVLFMKNFTIYVYFKKYIYILTIHSQSERKFACKYKPIKTKLGFLSKGHKCHIFWNVHNYILVMCLFNLSTHVHTLPHMVRKYCQKIAKVIIIYYKYSKVTVLQTLLSTGNKVIYFYYVSCYYP